MARAIKANVVVLKRLESGCWHVTAYRGGTQVANRDDIGIIAMAHIHAIEVENEILSIMAQPNEFMKVEFSETHDLTKCWIDGIGELL